MELLRCLSHLFYFSQPSILASPVMTLEEVGTVPGSYRIVDMFCLREVLNQIMKVGVMFVPFLYNLSVVLMQVRARLLSLPEHVHLPHVLLPLRVGHCLQLLQTEGQFWQLHPGVGSQQYWVCHHQA